MHRRPSRQGLQNLAFLKKKKNALLFIEFSFGTCILYAERKKAAFKQQCEGLVSMGRPRKDAFDAPVEERIEQAYWHYATSCGISRMSVVALSEYAKCNRGTFYYYFKDTKTLLDHIIDKHTPAGLIDPFMAVRSKQAAENVKNADTDNEAEKLEKMCRLIRGFDSARTCERLQKRAVETGASFLGKTVDDLGNDERVALEFLAGGIVSVLVHYASNYEHVSIEDIRSALLPELPQALVAHTKRKVAEGSIDASAILSNAKA